VDTTPEEIKIFFGNRRIWTNGCYDILHAGHVKLFDYARSLGSELIVGIDSDRRVRELKGQGRPINNELDRREVLLANKNIKDVFVFDSPEELCELIKRYQVHTIVVGDEYRDRKVIGEEYCEEVAFFKKIEGYSTTNILDRNSGR